MDADEWSGATRVGVGQVMLDEVCLALPPTLRAGDELTRVDSVFEHAGDEVVLERLLDAHERSRGKRRRVGRLDPRPFQRRGKVLAAVPDQLGGLEAAAKRRQRCGFRADLVEEAGERLRDGLLLAGTDKPFLRQLMPEK